jgi:hypothetical protein
MGNLFLGLFELMLAIIMAVLAFAIRSRILYRENPSLGKPVFRNVPKWALYALGAVIMLIFGLLLEAKS